MIGLQTSNRKAFQEAWLGLGTSQSKPTVSESLAVQVFDTAESTLPSSSVGDQLLLAGDRFHVKACSVTSVSRLFYPSTIFFDHTKRSSSALLLEHMMQIISALSCMHLLTRTMAGSSFSSFLGVPAANCFELAMIHLALMAPKGKRRLASFCLRGALGVNCSHIGKDVCLFLCAWRRK